MDEENKKNKKERKQEKKKGEKRKRKEPYKNHKNQDITIKSRQKQINEDLQTKLRNICRCITYSAGF